jgi:flagellin-like hook-associated protein FlgL
MTVTGVGARSSVAVQALVDMRSQLTDLQRQLGTGKKSTTYAGLGVDAGLAVSLRGKLAAMTGYGDTITNVGTRIDLASSALTRIAALGHDMKGAAVGPFDADGSGQTTAQRAASSQLDEIVGLLNTQVGDRYLFSGRAVDKPAVETTDHILNGDGARAGFKQVLAERAQADLGANGLGRLVIPAASGSQVSVSEDVAGSPFGFKLSGVSATLTGATVGGPTGSPAGITVNFAGNPSAGDAITLSFTLPDGTSEKLTLSATTAAPPGAGQFTIGANAAATATNLQAALTSGIGKLAATALTAASAVAAAHDFFDVDVGHPPQRVAGPPFDTATALVAATASNTVTWYTGEMGSDPARGSAVAQVDDQLSVAYGVRGNEQAIRATVANIAVYAATTFAASDPNAADRYSALGQRIGTALAGPPGQQKIEDIQSEFAYAQITMQSASERQSQRRSTLQGLLEGIEGAPQEQVAAQILTLQTRLQASLQTTAMLYRISIMNYL